MLFVQALINIKERRGKMEGALSVSDVCRMGARWSVDYKSHSVKSQINALSSKRVVF